MNDPLLTLLQTKARYSDAELAEVIGLTPEEIRSRIDAWEKDGTISGYQAVIDKDKAGALGVSAFIEVKVTPERGGGFDRLAVRIAKFDQVVSCYLASGGYDLLVMVEGKDLREVASFVSDKLSSLDGIISTATHFRLKAYKENGFLFNNEEPEGRLSVSP
ncbi:Lrp/AsnC family transcriptional regulator [Akkermansiaceae bacterium]|nr:Lrp/AsnC family transcriptional regulator [Akkermansiaceae bacterium]